MHRLGGLLRQAAPRQAQVLRFTSLPSTLRHVVSLGGCDRRRQEDRPCQHTIGSSPLGTISQRLVIPTNAEYRTEARAISTSPSPVTSPLSTGKESTVRSVLQRLKLLSPEQLTLSGADADKFNRFVETHDSAERGYDKRKQCGASSEF